MKKHNPENERIKRRYLSFLKEAKRNSETTLDTAAKALSRFEAYTNYQDFKKFRFEQAIAFKKHLTGLDGKSGEKLSKATMLVPLINLKRFFQWLSGQPGYKARLQYTEAEYFNLSDKDTRIATAKRQQRFPTIEQIKHVLKTMPAKNEIEQRNRALMAFTILTGMRDSAIASLKLKHVDLISGCVSQDAREVNTKFSKTFYTYFFPVGDEIREIVSAWILYLKEEKLFGNDEPLFPATRIGLGANRQFEALGLSKGHWRNATAIRKAFREAFENAGLPYFNPHSFRNTLVQLGEKLCKSPEDFKAWSQNLGHEKVLTTFLSYGEVSWHRQKEIISDLAKPQV